MLDIRTWMNGYVAAVRSAFGDRVEYIGLQGSRARGEAGPESDIDVVCILDKCSPADLERYREAVKGLPEREKLCGFVSGAAELAAWDRADLFHFRRDTVDWYRHLADLLPPEKEGDARRALHTGGCGLYHLCCHNLLHGRSMEAAAEAYKSAVFLLRAKAYADGGVWLGRQAELRQALDGLDREVLDTAAALRAGACREDLSALMGRLLAWSQTIITSYTA